MVCCSRGEPHRLARGLRLLALSVVSGGKATERVPLSMESNCLLSAQTSIEIIRNFDSEFLKEREEGLLSIGTVDIGDVEKAFRGETTPSCETRQHCQSIGLRRPICRSQ